MDVSPICQSRRQMKARLSGGESENDIMENNGACYYVTGFQKTVKSLCTYAYIHSLHRHTHIQAHTQKRSRGFPERPPPPKSRSRSVKPPSFWDELAAIWKQVTATNTHACMHTKSVELCEGYGVSTGHYPSHWVSKFLVMQTCCF